LSNTYKAKDLEVLEGLEAVRKRPGMYIGTTSVKGLHHILWEIIDNAIDEAANGHASDIVVTLYKDGSASCYDNGRGIPVDKHPKLGKSGVEVVFTHLHAGGKFNNDNYAFSGGLHGVGAAVTNALSKWLLVEVYKGGKTYKMEFESREERGKWKSGVPLYPLKQEGKTDKQGTYVKFMPDISVFDTIVFNAETIKKRLKELAFLNRGLRITLTDLRDENEETQTKVYHFEGGIIDYVTYLNETKATLYNPPVYFEGQKDDIIVQLSFQHNDSYTDTICSFVNNIPTSEGGMHETGLKASLTKVLNDYARKAGFLKDKDQSLLGEDFREGFTCVLTLKMKNVQFEGQTKTKLGNSEARLAVEYVVHSNLIKFIDNDENKPILAAIMKKAISSAKAREAARKAKEIARKKSSLENANLVGKLASCTSKKAELNEIFIVEGDSAGGTAKQARDRVHQAILPLRGKPLNAEKKRLEQVLNNEEIRVIISALGVGIGEDFNLDGLKYHKVIILADADQDGAHIRAILMTFFFRYMKPLITEGHLYIGMPPLYKVSRRDVVRYAYTDRELQSAIAEVGRGYTIQRYKGLGEMNPEQLWETTMDPKKRSLIQVTIEDAADAEKLVTTLMGDNVEARRNYIQNYANFNKQDNVAELL